MEQDPSHQIIGRGNFDRSSADFTDESQVNRVNAGVLALGWLRRHLGILAALLVLLLGLLLPSSPASKHLMPDIHVLPFL